MQVDTTPAPKRGLGEFLGSTCSVPSTVCVCCVQEDVGKVLQTVREACDIPELPYRCVAPHKGAQKLSRQLRVAAGSKAGAPQLPLQWRPAGATGSLQMQSSHS